jgi:hypothetical protein
MLLTGKLEILLIHKICEKYNIPVLQPAPLTYKNAWLFLDSDGSIYLNLKSSPLGLQPSGQRQMFITAGKKK